MHRMVWTAAQQGMCNMFLHKQIEFFKRKADEIMVINISLIPDNIVGIEAQVKYAKDNNLYEILSNDTN